jgi:hypothetical protein
MSTKLKHPRFGIGGSQEREVIRALGNVGVLKLDRAKSVFGSDTIQDLAQKGFIKKDQKCVNGRVQSYIHLLNRGQQYARRYKRSSYQLSHDFALSEKYLSISREERKSWLNDYAVKKHVEAKDPEAEPVDGAYRNELGELVGVEVFTASYDSETVTAKLDTLRTCFDNMATLHA